MSSYQPFKVPSRSKMKFVSCKKKANKRRPACKKGAAEIQLFLGYSLKRYCYDSRAGEKRTTSFQLWQRCCTGGCTHGISHRCREQPNVAPDACAGSSEPQTGGSVQTLGVGAGRRQRPAGIFNSLKFPLITCTSETLQGSLLIDSS